MNKIILCVGDSLGMPRQGIQFVDTWFYQIHQVKGKEFFFVNNFRRALTSDDLKSADFLENYSPHTIILQIGIVDCAPRYFKKDSIIVKLVNSSPSFFQIFFWDFVKKIKNRSDSNSYVTLDNFKKNIENYVERCNNNGVIRLIVIAIPTPGSSMLKSNPGIAKSINRYNEVFKTLSFKGELLIVNPLIQGESNDYLEDGYHLSKHGFDKVFSSLLALIK